MNNLESLSFDIVVNSNNISYKQWRAGLKPVYSIVWGDILLGYFSLVIILLTSYYIQKTSPYFIILNGLISSFFLGFILAYIALFIHEAGHFNIHPNKKKNDLLATICFGLLFGVDIRSYRKIHWQHHLHLGTTLDTEISYFNSLNWSFLFKILSGIHTFKTIRNKNSQKILTSQMQSDSFRMLLVGMTFNLVVIFALLFWGGWLLTIEWVLAIALFFPFFASLRQLLEHRSESAVTRVDYKKTPHGKVSRLFRLNLFSRFFGGAGFTHHIIHHWDPQVSYTRLKDVHKFLADCNQTKEIIAFSETTYSKTFKKLFS